MSTADETERRRLLGRLRAYFARRRSPRATLTILLLVTGGAGFVASLILLKCGLGQMWLRYPLAVLAAWGVFLALVRAWAERERANFRLDEQLSETHPPESASSDALSAPAKSVMDKPRPKRAWNWWDWLDLGDLISVDAEGCLVVVALGLLVAALAGAVVAVIGLIGEAEVLLAEVFLDAVLVSALYQRLSRLKPRWWLAGALRQTVWPVLFTTVFLMVGGIFLQQAVPGAKSLGEIWHHYFPRATQGEK